MTAAHARSTIAWMRGAALVTHAAIAFVVAACGRALEVDAPPGDAGGNPPIADAAPEAAVPGDGGSIPTDDDASVLAGEPNLHPNGSFETGCAPWAAFQGTMTHVTSGARTGVGACRFCTNGSGTYFTADDAGSFGKPVVGAEYAVEAWVRSVDGKAMPPRVSLALRTRDTTKTKVEGTQVELGTALSTQWQRMRTNLSVTKDAAELAIVVGADRSADECFLLDDVTLVRVR